MGRDVGLSARRDERSDKPAFVRYENCERGSSGVSFVPDEEEEVGRRRDFAFGRDLKPGQEFCVGGPVSAKICLIVSHFFASISDKGKGRDLG